MHLITVLRAACVATCAAVANGLALQRRSAHSIFIFGSSVDRYAVQFFCGIPGGKFYRLRCTNEERDLNIGYSAHPGVGMNGDLQPPFWNHTCPRFKENPAAWTSEELHKHALRIMDMQEGDPDMVVVESSLWDLFTWASWSHQNVTKQRLGQWGDRDLKNLMARVSEAFPQSRIVFRTAPQVQRSLPLQVIFENDSSQWYPDVAVVSSEAIDMMKVEVDRHMQNGKLYGKYEVVDYYKIMNDLIKERGLADPALWMRDGTHPTKEPARRYMNEILQLMHLATVSPEHWGREMRTTLDDEWKLGCK